MIVISDTAPIIIFGRLSKLFLLKELYNEVYIPLEVWNELIYPLTQKVEILPKDLEYELEAKKSGWLIVKNPEKEENVEIALKLSQKLGIGEAYAIALSIDLSADILIINDKEAMEEATNYGIKTMWITDVLLEAASKNLIKSYKKFQELLDLMVENGLWIEKDYLNQILENAKKIFDLK